ncbi:MAG: 2Fe-2S iron-sulfur cluster-binding protein, partial [Proteobacteria bacterium]|nr:2Fe-2S iron-sulfur cluster-binding protein [Pseudomonadota bacterium]
MTDETLTVEIWRGKDTGRFETYQVPHRQSQTILDVVTWIQRHREPALAYRFACRVGMCGSCAMTVNGRPRWTCRTHVSKVAASGGVRIEPLRNLPRIKDLVTDMTPFFEKWQTARGRFE